MLKYFKLHKQAQELLRQGAELVDKSKYTELEEWEVKRFVLKAVPLADECSKVALPNDAAGLYVCANLLDNYYNKGVLINEETYTQFIEFMYDKIAKAQNKKEEIAMREAIMMMQKMLN